MTPGPICMSSLFPLLSSYTARDYFWYSQKAHRCNTLFMRFSYPSKNTSILIIQYTTQIKWSIQFLSKYIYIYTDIPKGIHTCTYIYTLDLYHMKCNIIADRYNSKGGHVRWCKVQPLSSLHFNSHRHKPNIGLKKKRIVFPLLLLLLLLWWLFDITIDSMNDTQFLCLPSI